MNKYEEEDLFIEVFSKNLKDVESISVKNTI